MWARTRLLQMVVLPCTPTFQVAEDALFLSLVALVVGTQPVVTTTMMWEHLHAVYRIDGDFISVHRYRLEHFIVCFFRQAGRLCWTP